MHRRSLLYVLFVGLLLAGCNFDGRQIVQAKPLALEVAFDIVDTLSLAPHAATVSHYPLPQVPDYIRNPEERGRYVLYHFFDGWPPESLSQITSAAQLEQSIVDYLSIYQSMPASVVSKLDLLRPLESTQQEVLSEVLKIYAKYLYEADSPLKNHNDYIQVLQWATNSTKLSYVDQIVYKDQLSLISKNQVGTLANDFSFISPQHLAPTSLRSLEGRSVLLLFYVPGCDRCEQLLSQVERDEVLRRSVEQGKITLLYVCLVYEQLEWQAHLDEVPSFGVPVFNNDQSILNQSTYDLTYTPVMYLLDERGVVVRKETTLSEVRQYLVTIDQ